MPDQPSSLTLEIVRPAEPPERRVLSPGRVVIGRESGDIVLRDAESSALHAELEFSRGAVIVRDLGSRNGTWRKGATEQERLPQFALYPGQSFFCGQTEIRLVSVEGATAPRPGQTAVGLRQDVDESMPTIPRTTGVRRDAPAVPLVLDPQTVRHPLEPPRDQARAAAMRSSGTNVPGGAPPPAQGPSSPTLPGESASTLPGERAVTVPGERAFTLPATDHGSAQALRGRTEIPRLPEPAPLADPGASDSQLSLTPDTSGSTVVPSTGGAPEAPSPPTEPPSASGQDPAAPSPPPGSPMPFAAPVANAVIKEPGASKLPPPVIAAPSPPVEGNGRSIARVLLWFALTLAALAVLGTVAFFAYRFFTGRNLSFTQDVAAELPQTAVGFAALSSPSDLIALLGEDVPAELVEASQQTIGADLSKPEGWQALGVDPEQPVGLGLLSIEQPVAMVSVGIIDRQTARASLQDKLGPILGTAEDRWVERSFAEVEGLWLDEPVPLAVLWRSERAQVVFGLQGSAGRDAVEEQAKTVAGLQRAQSLARTEGLGAMEAPPGDALLALYVDGPALRKALPADDVEGTAIRLALGDVDAFAATLSHASDQIHLTQQTILREGSRELELLGGVERGDAAFDKLGGPLLAGFEVAFDPEVAGRSIGDLASLLGQSSTLFEDELERELGVNIRKDVIDNIAGTLGAAMARLPGPNEAGDEAGFSVVAWVSLADAEQMKVTLDRAHAKLADELGARVRQEHEVSIYSIEGELPVTWFSHEGYLWIGVGPGDPATLIAGADPSFRDESPDAAIVEATEADAPMVAFVNLAEVLELARVEASEREAKRFEAWEPVLSLLDAVTIQGRIESRSVVVQATLHTTEEPGLATLVQRVIAIEGAQAAQAVAARARQELCAHLVEHVMALTRQALEKSGGSLPDADTLERQVLEECSDPLMTQARLDCYLAADSVEALQACDRAHPDAPEADSGRPEDHGSSEQEPKPVPYVDDIWPHTQDDPDSKKPQPNVNYAVDVGPDPHVRGSEDALVTIVEFADFQCPYCRRMAATLDEVLAEHGESVRLVFRHRPLTEIHPEARIAARAAVAAGKQGKFWQMHDKLFAHPSALRESDLREHARALGLDMTQFDRDFYDAATERRIERDLQAAENFGVDGTPVFFVNGRYLPGTQSKAAFGALIAEEKQRALSFVQRRGDTRVRLYEDMISHFAPEVIVPSQVATPPDPDEQRFLVSTEDLPRKGAAEPARVQIVECGDFDCPFCARARKTIDEILDRYPSQVAFYFAHKPLDFHPGAEPAARAAQAAAAQDKFWDMHDALFENGDARTDTELTGLARRIGLDVAKFEADFEARKTADEVKRQSELCTKHEVTGTPTFFVNGRKLAGAQSLERFTAIIDSELASGI